MNEKLLTLDFISPSILKPSMAVLMDGEKVVVIDEHSLRDWRRKIGKDLPIFANEVDEHTLEEWKFTFQTGSELTNNEIERAHMSKPYWQQHRVANGSWGGCVTPCDVSCRKCKATYPIWGKFVIKQVQTCAACGYKYEFTDI